MKFSSTLSLLSLSAVAYGDATPAAPAEASPNSFAKPHGHAFEIGGKAQYYMGTNACWLSTLTNNSDVDLAMSHMAESGLKVIRIFGFSDVTATPDPGSVWFQSLIPGQDPVINTGVDGLQRLDYVVKSAEAHGITLIISFVNNWIDYGGIKAYVQYYNLTVPTWYTSTLAQAQYQRYIAAIVSRYKNSSAVFSWQLANEPRCHECPVSTITNWANITSAYIKSLDSNHMVSIGDEGFGMEIATDNSYATRYVEGLDFIANLALPNIDFGTVHLYPQPWNETDDWAPKWIEYHATAAAALGKPVILEEYGTTTKNKSVMLPWQQTVLSTDIGGEMFWQYGDTLSTGPTNDDGHTIYYGSDFYKTFVVEQAARLSSKTVV